jgi:hypothetical protein
LYHKIFDSKQLAEKYIEELTIVTDEAEWVEIRMFSVHNEESILMTPIQEDLYWDSIYNLQKQLHYENEF